MLLLLLLFLLQEGGGKTEDFMCGEYLGDDDQDEAILVGALIALELL